MSDELKAHEGRIAYCIWHGITMGRKAGKSGAALMSGGNMVSDEQYAKDVAAQVMKESAFLLSALTAAEARAEAAEAALAKVRDTYWQDDEEDVATAMFHIANNALTRTLKGTPDAK